jgi:hypothetical protein
MKTSNPLPKLKSESDYARRVRGLAHGLWSGDIEPFAFVDGMVDLLFRNYEIAWQEGARQCGMGPGERSLEEADRLRREILADQGRIMGYTDWIVVHSKALGFKFETVKGRAEIWANRYNSIVTLAQVTACADKKMVWYFGATEQHCNDCASYDGKVFRASTWARYGAIPRSHNLECGGWRCDCRLVPTDAPVTPGHPRYPTGG